MVFHLVYRTILSETLAIGNAGAIADEALGACAIEKHFTINGNEKGPDSEFSIEPNELKELVRDSKNA